MTQVMNQSVVYVFVYLVSICIRSCVISGFVSFWFSDSLFLTSIIYLIFLFRISHLAHSSSRVMFSNFRNTSGSGLPFSRLTMVWVSDGLIWLNQLTSLWRILVDMTFLHSLPQIHLEIRSTPIILAPERYLGFVIPSNINSRISGIGPNWYIAESRRPGCGGAYGAWNGLAKT